MLRKLLIALSIFLFLVFLLALVLPRVIDLDQYKPALIALAEDRINGTANIKHIELTILSGLGAGLHEVEILNAERFGGSPFLKVKQLEIKIRLLPLLVGKISTRIILEAPQILIEKSKEGIFSFDELIKWPGSQAEPSVASKVPSWVDRFSISALRIKDGKITYISHSDHPPKQEVLALNDLNLKVEAFSLNEPIPFELALGKEESSLERLGLKGMVQVDLEHSRIDFLPTYLTTGDLILKLSGRIEDYKDSPTFMLSISSNQFAPSRLLGLYSPATGEIPSELSVSGLSSLKGTISGDFDNLLIKGKINCSENTIRYGDTFQKSEGVPAGLTFSLLKRKDSLRINELEFNLSTLKLRGSGSVDNLRDPKIELKATTNQVRLKDWEEMFPSLGLSSLSGGFRLEGASEGKIKGLKGLSFRGEVLLNEVGASVPWLTQDIKSLNGELKFSSDAVIARALSLKLGDSDIDLDFDLSNFKSPRVSFDLSSNQLDLDELLPKSREKKSGEEKGKNPEAGEGLLDRFTAQGKVKAARGKVKGLSFENLFLTLSLKKKLLSLSNLSFDLCGGSYQGDGKLDLGAQEPTYIFQSHLKDVKIDELLSRFPSLKGLLSGFLSAELSLSGKGMSLESLSKNLSGAGKFTLNKGSISIFSLEKNLSVLSKLKGWGNSSSSTDFQALEGQVNISEGRVNTSDLRLNNHDLSVTASGYFDRNRQVEYRAQVVLSRRQFQGLESSSGGEFYKDEGERIIIPFLVKGTIDSPEFSLDREELVKGQREWALRKTEAELNKMINKDLNR